MENRRDKSGRGLDKNIRPLVVILSLVVFALTAIFAPQPAKGETLGSWSSTTAYPTGVFGQSCPTSGGYIYCVGGATKNGTSANVYYAPISSSGVGAWVSTTAYPVAIGGESCAIFGGYIYCVGGGTGGTSSTPASPVNSVYYAPISSSGVGTWTSTTTYPTAIAYESCTISGGYIYCVGGFTGSVTSAVYYAAISSSGVGSWNLTTGYPTSISQESCAISSGEIYCVGGFYGPTSKAVYYAPIASTGVGAWVSTTAYPTPIAFESCAIFGGYVYCVGGSTSTGATSAVYFSTLTAAAGTSTQSTSTSSMLPTTSSQSTPSTSSSSTSLSTTSSTSASSTTSASSQGGGTMTVQTCIATPLLSGGPLCDLTVKLNHGDTISGTVSISGGSPGVVLWRIADPVGATAYGPAQGEGTFSFSATQLVAGGQTYTWASGVYTFAFDNSDPSSNRTVTLSYQLSSPSGSGGGGIPEFPYQLLTATVATTLVAVSYLLVRRHTLRSNQTS